MIKVAIVDDNEIFLREMRQIVESCSGFMADMVCDTYTSGIDFLRVGCGAYQLVILDMQIERKNGYETAKKLREIDDSVVIAFISGVVFPEPKHFRVQPYRYLLKNADSEEIRRDVEELLQETKERYLNETVEVTGDGRAWRVPIRSILYVAKAKRGSLFTIMEEGGTGEGTILHSNERLDNWYGELCTHGFEYAHSSYIVNLKSITKIMTDKLTLSNGEVLGISRACRKKFHESFSLYFHKKYQRGN